MLTNRQIFDTVKNHLLTQGDRAEDEIDGEIGCAYRGDAGAKCAVGCLIPDDKYTPEIEGVALGSYVGTDASYDKLRAQKAKLFDVLRASGVDVDNPETERLLQDLQSCHDNTPPVYWEERLVRIEREYFPACV